MKTNPFKTRHCLVGLVVLAILSLGLYQLWLMWPSLVLSSIQWQREVNAQLADLLYEAKAAPWVAGSYLIGFSFIYGMLHSLGPGHGKVIVSTYLATHPAKAKASLVLTVVSALLQALVAILLVSVLLWGFNASMRVINDKANMFVALSFALVALVGVLICYKALKNIFRSMRQPKLQVKTIQPLSLQAQTSMKAHAPVATAIHAVHTTNQAHTDCGCGHQHVADAEAINSASTLREYAGIIVTIGARPCTGAIMVLLFANVVGMYWMGMLSALAMAIGTALTTSLIAIMTLTGKHLVKRYLAVGKKGENGSWKVAGHYLQLFGGVLLVIIGMLLMNGQDAGMSPIFSV